MLAGAEVAIPLCKPTLSCAHTLSKSRDVQRGCGWGAPAGRAVLSQPTQVEPDRHLPPFCNLRMRGASSRANLGEWTVPCRAWLSGAEPSQEGVA